MSLTRKSSRITEEIAQMFVSTAYNLWNRDGEIERDIGAKALDQVIWSGETLDELPGGMYVKAWVWVSMEEVQDEQPADRLCRVCGKEFLTTESGINHHALGDRKGIDYDADANHVAY